MSFPATVLNLKVELALLADLTADPSTWSWTDVTTYVYSRDKIRITHGGYDGAVEIPPSALQFTADNRDGRWCEYNPSGAWHEQLSRGTPVRVSVNEGTNSIRMTAFIVSLPPRWDVTGNDAYVPVVAAGTTRRLQRGKTPLRSPLLAGLGATLPDAWWPLEGRDAPKSGLTNGASMARAGQVMYGSEVGQPGSAALPNFTGGGTLTARLPNGSVSNEWRLEFVARFGIGSDTITDSDFTVPVRMTSPSGTVNNWELLVSAGTAIFQWSDTSGAYTALVDSGVVVDDGEWHHFRLAAVQSGGNITATITVDGATTASSSLVGKTLNSAGSSVAVNPAREAADYVGSVGHLAYWAPFSTAVDTYFIASGYDGESADDRVTRLGAESGVTVEIESGSLGEMGPQPVAPFLHAARECETFGGGRLFDNRDPTDADALLRMRWAADIAGQTAVLALNHDSGHLAPPFEPQSDDQYLRNDWTAYRPGGSWAHAVAETGNLTPTKVGTYDDSVTINTQTDADLINHASWRVSLGTVEGLRFPQITLNFARNPALIADWIDCEIGSRITITNPPDGMSPDTVDVIIEGWTEMFSQFEWTTTLNCSPYKPYAVGVLAATSGDTDPNLGWLDWDSCEIPSSVNSSDTTWVVTAFPTDTTTADDFPRDVYCGGELVTCTASATAVADGFGRSASSGWGTADTGQSWANSGGTATDFSVSAGDAWQLHSAVNTLKGNVIVVGARDQYVRVLAINPFGGSTGAPITHWVCPRWTDSSNYYVARLELNGTDVQLSLQKRVAGVLTALVAPITVGSNHVGTDEWIVDARILSSTLSAKAWLSTNPEPTTWQASITDTDLVAGTSLGLLTRFETGNTNTLPQSLRWDDLDVMSARTWTVTRSVNAVVKAHGSNSDITLAHPFVLAL